MDKPKNTITDADVELIAKTFDQKPSEPLMKKIMEGLDRVDADIARGILPRTVEPPSKERRRGPKGRGGIGD